MYCRLFIVLMFYSTSVLYAQYDRTWPDQLSGDDSAAIYALALYPDSVRLHIFEACEYPELIVRVSNLQKSTSDNFAALLQNYSQEDQEGIWDLTRYPGLIDRINEGGIKSKSELKEIADAYPEESYENIMNYGKNEFNLLAKIQLLTNTSSQKFNSLMRNYPIQIQHAFDELLAFPEVMNILNDHLQMAVLVGDMYKKDPDKLIQTADSLSLVAAQRNAENIEAWKKSLADNPSALEDLKSSAAEYATENGYQEEEYTTASSNYYVEHYVCYPYPYWFGYPYWYPYSYWYPYPWWYDWGFYYDPFGNMVIIGLPSYYFTYWYFYYPNHYYHHPYLAGVYIDYYYGPRTVRDENTNIVRGWVTEKEKYLPDNFFTANINKADAIKQIGEMEVQWGNHNADDPLHQQTKDEFILQNKEKYPTLNAPDKKDVKVNKRYPVINPPQKNPPVKQPPVRVPNQNIPQRTDPQKNKPQYNFPNVNRAQQLHKSGWVTPSRGNQ